MLDFKELDQNGETFELLIRDILARKGFQVQWSGRGADGGKDIICIERRDSFFAADSKKWLVQCKHNARSGKSVSHSDLDDIVDSCTQHNAEGYLLACSTQPSSGAISRLEGITNNPQNNITAVCWDSGIIEDLLATPLMWSIAHKYMPVSSAAMGLNVYATDQPNCWIVNYRGYYFSLNNRIGSSCGHHFASINNRIEEIENIDLPEKHFIRIRSIFYDDKGITYTWYLDYMYPHKDAPALSTAEIAHILGDGYALEDGQCYSFDIKLNSYLEHSDHFDPDHYDYYIPYINNYSKGFPRLSQFDTYEADEELKAKLERLRDETFSTLKAKFSELDFLHIIRAVNAGIEDLDKFHAKRKWSDLIFEMDIQTDRFFSAWFLFEAKDDKKFHQLVSMLPQHVLYSFRLTKPYIYIPDKNGSSSKLSQDDSTDNLYELTLSLHPAELGNKFIAREKLNEYFELILKQIDVFISENN